MTAVSVDTLVLPGHCCRVLLHSNRDAVEVFLVQHAAQHCDSSADQQHTSQQQAVAAETPGAPAAATDPQAQIKPEQDELLQALLPQQPSSPAQHHQHQQQSSLPAAMVGPDISMEPPGHLGDAAAAAAAGSGHTRPPALQQQHLSAAAALPPAGPQASPITLLAKAIGSGNIQPHDVPVAANLLKHEQNGPHHPAANAATGVVGLGTVGSCPTPNFAAMAGLNSPLFPPGIGSPNLSVCVASPAQQAKWAEGCGIDPEIWFAADDGGAGLGMGDMFKDNTSIYQPPAAGEQQDADLVAAW